MSDHALGVHLCQRHEDYLGDSGLGYSSTKDLYLSPVEWWNDSHHNPLRDTSDDESRQKAFKRGEALHTYVLYGAKEYGRIYAVRPTKRTHPAALDTVRDLQAECRRLGLDPRGLKPELAHRLKVHNFPRLVKRKAVPVANPAAPALINLQDEFDRSGKKEVTDSDDFRIQLLHRMMMRDTEELQLPDGHITLKAALDKALTEVSVYWEDENGIRQRARFDILKPNFIGDLKSITQWRKTDFKKSLLAEIIFRGYMIQVAHYWEGRRQLRIAVDEGRVFGGNKTQRKLLQRIADAEKWAWVFIFAKMDGAPQVRGIVIREEMAQFKKAVQQREEALAKYLWNLEFHGGLDRPWFDPEVVWEPQDTDWPFAGLGE